MKSLMQLKRLRQKTKNQQELAGLLGVSLVTINTWLQEKSHPRKKHQEKIFALYEDFFGPEQISSLVVEKTRKEFSSLQYSFSLTDFLHSDTTIEKFLVGLTYNSNSIEGSTVTHADTYEIVVNEKTFSSYSLREQLEVQNHKKAFLYLLSILQTREKFSEKHLLSLHKLLMAGILENAGQFRYHSVRILGSGVTTANHLTIPTLIQNFLEDCNTPFVPEKSLFHLAKSHAIFEKIHPFSDGNGRIGRLLLLFLSFSQNFPPLCIAQEKKSAYYSALQHAQTKQDYVFLEMVIGASVWKEAM